MVTTVILMALPSSQFLLHILIISDKNWLWAGVSFCEVCELFEFMADFRHIEAVRCFWEGIRTALKGYVGSQFCAHLWSGFSSWKNFGSSIVIKLKVWAYGSDSVHTCSPGVIKPVKDYLILAERAIPQATDCRVFPGHRIVWRVLFSTRTITSYL